MKYKFVPAFLFIILLITLTACPGNEQESEIAENYPEESQEIPQQSPSISALPSTSPAPTVKPEDPNEISSYATELLNKDEDRIHNIKLAADELNHTLLNPGEVFSFNGILGKRTSDKGYEKAPILLGDGQKGEGTGGGICQISSTLYNAALEADMEIIERHRHSEPVPYVPEGKDATVVYNSKDLRFKNTKDYPVEILVSVSEDEVTVRLYKKKESED